MKITKIIVLNANYSEAYSVGGERSEAYEGIEELYYRDDKETK